MITSHDVIKEIGKVRTSPSAATRSSRGTAHAHDDEPVLVDIIEITRDSSNYERSQNHTGSDRRQTGDDKIAGDE